MDSQRLLLSRENPRPLGFPAGRVLPSATVKSMPNEMAQKPIAPAILERFKALLKRRYDQRGSLADDDVPQLPTEEIVQLYDIVLSELTLNSKPIITELTIIAGDHKEHGKGIADAICDRILEVPLEQKLPSLYLLDSIVKNIGGEYVRYFSSRLPEVFCEAYQQVHPNLHNAMRHLFGTWSTVFPTSVLRKIEGQLHFSQAVNNQNISSSINPPRASEATQRTHGIHVNPKYLRQLENSTMDTDGGEMLDSTGSVGHKNFDLGTNKMHQASISRQGKHYPGDGRNQFQFSTNGLQRQSPRALIDAYGSDKRTETPSNKPLVEPLDIHGIENKMASPSWQNTEEEEFNWEDMSPTLMEHKRSNGILPSSIMLSGERSSGIVAANAAALGQDARSDWNGGGSLGQITGFQNHGLVSRPPHDTWKISHHLPNSSQHLINVRGQTRNAHVSPIDSIPITKVNSYGLEIRPPTLPASFRTRPPVNVHASRPRSSNPSLPKLVGNQFEAINGGNTILDQGPTRSLFMPEQLLDSGENNIGKLAIPQIPNQLSGLISSNQRNRGQALRPQIFPPQDVRESFADSQAAAASQSSHGGSLQRHGTAISATGSMLPIGQFPLLVQNMANNTFPIQQGALPPFPAPRPPSQALPHRNGSPYTSSQQPAGAFSGLIGSLMAQGLISLTGQTPAQDSVGTEFNPDVLKIRHESAIVALYSDLPRQCTTCGLRFKSQEEHSSHMDWHVTKNRMAKNRKQKSSRKWFVSEKMWLSGAEALGTEAAPGFLPTETVEENKEDEEMAVLADEEQNTCALCGEPFEEFYSDETEEWMYRGAVYLNVPKGTVAGMDRSQLGPIVHAKCRSESNAAPAEEFREDDRVADEEGSQRKRMRN
ncbi:hypothetical protein QN277_001244 [Acacia crassicarpa]|uniref:CID domain-containing protein n=1 Tax=Acacia crassicarpa TaxID=499986 RepID=A0AAE1TGV3_9FABA|nr:hypothetical protein QN277_001244 [Acacia crassicarpa]